MKRLMFVRHGESEANTGGISRPNAEIILTEKGQQQAQKVAEHWQDAPSQIYVSEFIRTTQTAQPLMDKYEIQPIQLAGLNEFNTFGYDYVKGLTGQQRLPLTLAYWRKADPEERCGELGQTYQEFCTQVAEFIPMLLTLEDNSVLFGHGMWFTQLMWQTLGFGQHITTSKNMKSFMKFHMSLHVRNTEQFNLYVADQKVFIQKHG